MAIFPVVCIAILLLLLNIVAPTTTDVRVVNYVVPIVPQVRGRVIEVPVENNRPVKKNDVLFRIDPTPFRNEVASLEARLKSEEAKVGAERARLSETRARLSNVGTSEPQLREELNETKEQVSADGVAGARGEARRAEHRAGGDRRRQPLRPRTGADERQGADRANCRGAAPRQQQVEESSPAAWARTWLRSPR